MPSSILTMRNYMLIELTKSLRMVAATERNIQLQESLFEVAEKYDSLQSKLDAYVRCQEQTTMMIGT